MGDQLYIGTPNGVVVCVDGLNDGGCYGSFYHGYQEEGIPFHGLGEMLFRMDGFFDELNFPRRANNIRSFTDDPMVYRKDQEREKLMSDSSLLSKHGKQETFIVRVQHRQNNTWQGRITWAEKNKTLTFRSIWEMVHLMENALYEDASPEEIPQVQSWEGEAEQE